MPEFHTNDETVLTTLPQGGQVSPNAKRLLIIVIVAALLLIAALWIWKSLESARMQRQAEEDIRGVKTQAAKQIVQAHESHLKEVAKAYVWSVRTELMQGNINQVNLYANDMVKEKNFQRIVVANNKNIIISSTNKKDEGQPFSILGVDTTLSGNITTVQNMNDSILIMTTPVMGFNTRLGTLYIKYLVEPPKFN